MANIETPPIVSKQFTVNWYDISRGLLIAVLSPVFTIILTSLNAGSLTFDWKVIGAVALSAALSYILKNFLTPTKIIVTDTKTVAAVKEGDAELKVIAK